jgi:Fungal specific transcription factor domain
MGLSTGQAPLNTNPRLLNSLHPPSPHTPPGMTDTIFGFSSQLWPTLHRLARAAHAKRRIGSESMGTGESSNRRHQLVGVVEDLKTEKIEIANLLQRWRQPTAAEIATPADSRESQMLVDHAEAYRAAGLIYLYRELYELEPGSPEVQGLAKTTLEACQRLLAGNGPTLGLLWPLFTAATNLVEDTDIVSARGAFSDLAMQRRMSNISVAWKICEQVWIRRGRGMREANWHQASTDPSEAIVFG